jgi:hypothetical protein
MDQRVEIYRNYLVRGKAKEYYYTELSGEGKDQEFNIKERKDKAVIVLATSKLVVRIWN